VALKKAVDVHRERITELEKDLSHMKARGDAEERRTGEVLIKSMYSYL
jgi:hypothetical protein